MIQWLTSERRGHSVIPIAFWYCSLVGGLLSFTYIVHQQEWPLLLGAALPLPPAQLSAGLDLLLRMLARWTLTLSALDIRGARMCGLRVAARLSV